MQRDGYNTQNALQRIDAQIPIDEKKDNATYLVDNTGSLEELEIECKRLIEKIKNEDIGNDSN